MKQATMTIILLSFMVLVTGQAIIAGQAEHPAASLAIHITGFDNTIGVARVAIVNSKENYESNEKPFMGFSFEISDNEVNRTISLPHGEYAVKVFHDENNNGKLDTRMFGIPAERYGFSNNAGGKFGPPEYEDAKFIVEPATQKISITVQ